MGAKTKEVGGGASTGLANDFTAFLRQQLQGTGGQQPQQPRPNFSLGNLGGNLTGVFGGGPNIGASNPDGGMGLQQNANNAMMNTNPQASTGNAMQNALTNQLSGNYQEPNWQVNTSGLQQPQSSFGFQPFNPQTTDFSQFQNPLTGWNAGTAPGINSNSQLQGSISGLQGIGSYTPQQKLEFSKNFGAGSVNVPGAAPQVSMGNVDISPYTDLWDRNAKMGLADTRARFGAAGGAAFGTPAAFAESNFLNENNANRAAAMSDIGRQQQELKLQEGQINSNNYNQYANNATQAGIAGLGNQTQMFGNMLGNQVNALGQAGQLSSDSLGQEAKNYLTGQGFNLDALKGQGMLDADIMKAASQQGIDIQSLLNQNQEMRAQNQLGTNQLNMDSLARALGLQMQGNQLNQAGQQFGFQQQGNQLNQLMGYLQNMSMPGIAQRQMIQQPSTFQNVMGGIAGIAGAAAPFLGTGGLSSLLGGAKKIAGIGD